MTRGLLPIMALLLILPVCREGPPQRPDPIELSPQVVREITGLITDLEGDRMTVRGEDGAELVFHLGEDPPVSLEHLRDHMEGRLPVRVTYRTESTRLVPITIDDA